MSFNALQSSIDGLVSLGKGICPSTASGQPQQFVLGVPGAATSRFSLPSRCLWVSLISPGAFSYAYASAASVHFIPVAAATEKAIGVANGPPLDLSGFSVFAAAAASGNTLCAWVQQAAAL